MLRITLIAGFFGTCAAMFPADESLSIKQPTQIARHSTTVTQDRPAPLASPFNISSQLHGVTMPSQMANLPSLVPGTIVEVHVKEGQAVKKGDALVTLDDRVPKARLAAATVEANLMGALRQAQVEEKMAKNRLNRLQTAMSKGASADFELEEAEGLLDQAKAAVEQRQDTLKAAEANRQLVEAQLAQYTISAPFDGLVTEIHQKSGAVDPSLVLITVANLSSLDVEMHLPSHLFGTISTGQQIKLQAGTPISQSVGASVVSVSPIINSASNTFRCLLQIDNSRSRLPAGFSVVLDSKPNESSQTGQAAASPVRLH